MKALSPVGAGLSRLPAPMGLGGRVGRRQYAASRESRRRSTLGPLTRRRPWRTRSESPPPGQGSRKSFDLHALKAFAPDTRVRKMLFKTDQLWSEIACYEPGQSTVMHTHPREEEAIFVLEGTANMNIAGEEIVVPAGAIVKFPSNVPHDV